MAITRAVRRTVPSVAFWALLILTALTASVHLGASPAQAAVANLSWQAPATNTDGSPIANLAGYKVHIGTSSGNYSQHIDVGNTTSYSTSSLIDGSTYYFAVTAYDASKVESPYSNEASKTFAALPTSYTITATAGTGGTITALNNTKVNTASSGTTTLTTVTVLDGASQSFSIAPAAGYRIADVKVDGASVGAVASYTFANVKAAHSISATFALNPASYTITASAGTGGSITPSGATSVAANGSKSFTIAAAAGYKIAGVTVDGAGVGAVSSYTFSNVTANHTISATFAPVTYAITASAGTGGSISPAGTVYVNSGASKTFTITPSSGYQIASVKVDGVSVGAVSTYTIANVTKNYTISASFVAAAGRTVFAVNSGGGAFTDSDGVAHKADYSYSGGSSTVTTSSISNTVNDVLYQSGRFGNFSYNIPLPNGNYTVTLRFADWAKTTGQRIFDVKAEGAVVVNDLDIYARVGSYSALELKVPVTVADGVLNLAFVPTSSNFNAKVNAIIVKTR